MAFLAGELSTLALFSEKEAVLLDAGVCKKIHTHTKIDSSIFYSALHIWKRICNNEDGFVVI